MTAAPTRVVILDIDERSLDPRALGRWPWGRDKIVARMHAGLTSLFKKNGVELIAGSGTLVGDGTIDVALVDDAGAATGEHKGSWGPLHNRYNVS